ncbi:hypothetical protein MRX96_039693 [Rhipicephalus microplus]
MGHHAPLLLLWGLFTFALFPTATSSDCGIMNCYANYKDGSCDNVAEFRACLSQLAKKCSYDLTYRAVQASLSQLNCSDAAATETPKRRPTKETCLWRSGEPKEEWRQCILPIGDKATVLSKVTIGIHAHGGCAMEKTYEADIKDNPLPTVFVDGSPSAGKGVRLTPLNSSFVELVLSHAGVRLLIRQQGDFLSVALRLPSSLAGHQPSQLCLQGCSLSERVQVPQGEPAWRLEEADAACRAANLTGAYRDACVFDVLATGQKEMAAEASAAAVADLKELGAAAAPQVIQQPSAAALGSASAAAIVANLLLTAWLHSGSCSVLLGAVR